MHDARFIQVGILKKVGTKSRMTMARKVTLWSNRVEYSLVNKQSVVGFMPTFGAEVCAVEGEPDQFCLRDGFGHPGFVEHIFVAASPTDRDNCT
jgi:hypothetical protein